MLTTLEPTSSQYLVDNLLLDTGTTHDILGLGEIERAVLPP